ncbi:MFS transporter [Gottschalkiaceae bacterium SANA]|nr:MFS transporter [Gottschalkiaceae bacterium SANA]
MTRRIIKEPNLIEIAAYGTGNMGYGLVSQMLTSYLVFYATAVLGMPGRLIGLIFFISVAWDAVSDPLMGYLSDHTRSRFGNRHIYILIGTIAVSITNLILWNIDPARSVDSKFLVVLISVLLTKTFLTIFFTPYSALGAELSNDYNTRSLVQAIKTAFFLIAIAFASAGFMFVFFAPTPEFPIGQLNPQAYSRIAILTTTIMLVTGATTYLSTKRFIRSVPVSSESNKEARLNFLKTMRFCLSQKDYRAILLGYLFTNLGSAMISTIGLHTFTYTFMLNNFQIGVVFGLQFTISILSQPIWVKLGAKMEKSNAVKLGLKISIIGCAFLFIATLFRNQVIPHYQFLFFYAIAVGFGTGGLFSLPLSMIADTVDVQEAQTGERNEGIYYGMLTFGYKISQSMAILLLGFVLDIIHFDSTLPVQATSTALLLGIFLSIGSILAMLLASKAYQSYSLDANAVAHLQAIIKIKHADH